MRFNQASRQLTSVVATFCAIVGFTFVLTTPSLSFAQISFGKMRGAAEQGKDAPKLETDEEEETFDVDPNEKSETKEEPSASKSSGRGTLRRRTANNSSNVSSGVTRASDSREARAASAEKKAGSTNVITNAVSKPLVDDEFSTTVDEKTPRATGTVKTRQNSDSAKKETKSEVKSGVVANERGPVLGKAVSHKYRAGMIFAARQGGGCTNVFGSAPVPMEFPEQKVRTLEEDFPRVAKVDYRNLKEGGARQMIFKMRELKPGQQVEATALFEVTRYPLLPPDNPEIYSAPRSPSREIKRYLKDGLYIESNSKMVRAVAKEALQNVSEDASTWDKIDAFLTYVRENVQYKEILIDKPMRGALAAIKEREGDCEDMSALFIAMCRSQDVPARLVRVPGHCWAEFYLVDDEKEGYWFPAQVAGTEPLGSMQDTRVILQKGDNYRLPETPDEESLYVKELFMGNVKENAPDPVHQFIQETDGK